MSEFYAPKSEAKPEPFTMTLVDLPNIVDAIFDGDHKRPGWVHMFANARGRSRVDALFPQACIEWPELPFPGLPPDWRGLQTNVTECVSTR